LQTSIKIIKGHLWKIVLKCQRDWDERLHLFLLAYRASTHRTTSTMSAASMLFERELHLLIPAVWGSQQEGTHN
jgi:hypothetical protein